MESKILEGLRDRLLAEWEKEGIDNIIVGMFVGDPATGDVNTSIFGMASGDFIAFGLTCLFQHIREEQEKQDNINADIEAIN